MRRRPGRRTVGGTTAAAAALITAITTASTAFACSAVMGDLSIMPTSGGPGTTITTSAQGLYGNATYAFHFANTTSGNCMSFTGVTTIRTITTDAYGTWSNVTAVIPAGATMGTHSTCGVETKPRKGATATTHLTFTVT